ncbi:MAG: hypothetical protein AAFX86_05065 [Pseudomonadota bacterium]
MTDYGAGADVARCQILVDVLVMDIQFIQDLLRSVSLQIANCDDPKNFHFEGFFSMNGCDAKKSILLSDYLVCACGRGFAREVGMQLSDTYQRRLIDGSWSKDVRYDADPIWLVVEEFVETIRPYEETRQRFSLIAQHSAEVDAISTALSGGATLESLKGAKFSGVFNLPL